MRIDRDGDRIGKVGAVYYDDATNEPSWLTVQTGFFGTKETFVPVQGADVSGDRVTVAYDKAKVKDAPNLDEDGHLTQRRSSSSTATTAWTMPAVPRAGSTPPVGGSRAAATAT